MSSNSPEHHGTKILDYVALGLLLAPPAVVFEIYVKGDTMNLNRTIGATAVCWIAGGFIAWASRAWQNWYSSGRMGPWLVETERKLWAKAIIVGLSVSLALFLSSLLRENVVAPQPTIEDIAKATKPIQEQLDAKTHEIEDLKKQLQARSAVLRAISSGDLTALSNDELKAATTQFVDELRKFEARFEERQNQLVQQNFIAMRQLSQDDKKAQQEAWDQHMTAETQLTQQHNSEYDVSFRGPVLRYKTQICKRLEFINPCPSNDAMGVRIDLSGPGSPIMVADYLTRIIGLLPND